MPTARETRMELHWGRLMRCYAQRPPTVDAMFRQTVARVADAEAVVDGAVRLTYRDVDALVDRVAAGFAALGLGAGDRIALMLPNRLEAVVSVLAITRLGAIVVPIGTRLRRPEIEFILADCGAAALVHDAAYAAEMPPPQTIPTSDRRICIGPEPLSFGGLADMAPRAVAHQSSEDDPFGILYTSGTTGRPKGAVITHLGAVHSCLHWVECLGLKADETTILCIPWSHVAGLCGVILPFLLIGGRQVLMADFKRRAFLELAAAEKITHGLLVPAMYGLLLLEPDLASFDLASWRLGVYGSAPMPEATIRRFAEAVPSLAMCNAYGATETTSPATIMPPGEGIAQSASIGRTVPCGEIRVMDEAGREVPVGETGEFWIAGPMIVPGYWRNPEADATSFAAGFWKSGDIGSIDAEGFVTIRDRKKDMIIRGGFKVYPAEVENVLCEHPGVVEAAVIGRDDPILGERAIAFVRSTDPDLTGPALRAFAVARLADYKVPDTIDVRADPLPRNANGKIQKNDLRRIAREATPAPGRRE